MTDGFEEIGSHVYFPFLVVLSLTVRFHRHAKEFLMEDNIIRIHVCDEDHLYFQFINRSKEVRCYVIFLF